MTGTRAGTTTDRGAPARLGMIEVAERLFAERGINGVSLREIGMQAGQRNTAAARYHFGSKEALVDAVFQHRMEIINERRMALLGELEARNRGHDARSLVQAFLYPLAGMLGEPGAPSWYMRFCVHAGYLRGTAARDLAREEWTRGVFLVRERLTALLADLPEGMRTERWLLLSSYLTHALADREMAVQYPSGKRPLTDRRLFLAELTDTAVALFLAPVTSGDDPVPGFTAGEPGPGDP